MSLHDYLEGRKVYEQDAPFYAYIQAAMRKADTKCGCLTNRGRQPDFGCGQTIGKSSATSI